MSENVPTIKVVRGGQVFTINMTDFDPKKDKMAKGEELAPLPPLDPTKMEMLFGSSTQPSTWTLPNGEVLQLGTVVAKAHEKSGMSVEEWNAIPQDDREARIAEMVDEMVPQAPAFKVAKRGRGNAAKFFILAADGKQFGDEDYATEEEANAKLAELTK